ncbi:branched-chain amino acid aminotransferase [Bacillus sp. 03113]|uniref:branched-chain amino acid aminotransferase n=1 Tax=Bacillus sp. 03113 TaxID=2578211 RepID=UPI0011440467|nr:branched-chain amino acid aminotransferase [Bacillus sp. 03113]
MIEEKNAQKNGEKIQIELYKEDKDYINTYQIISDEMREKITIVEPTANRFEDAYMERCDKETEKTLAEEAPSFLNQPIDYFSTHKNEFLYLESSWFDIIGVDAICLEVDDVFGTYDVMLGLKLQKKKETAIKGYLNKEIIGDGAKYDLMFIQEDGLWNLNFTLNFIKGFNEDLIVGEAYEVIYRFLFKLVEEVEKQNT